MAEINDTSTSTILTVTMDMDDYDAVTLRLEQICAMIKTLGIHIGDCEELPVSSEMLAVSLSGFATFISDTRDRMAASIQIQEGSAA